MARVDIFSKKYYTDWHDVDEDWVTLTVQGTAYPDGVEAGVINRRASASPGDTSSHVASVQKKITGLTHLAVMPAY